MKYLLYPLFACLLAAACKPANSTPKPVDPNDPRTIAGSIHPDSSSYVEHDADSLKAQDRMNEKKILDAGTHLNKAFVWLTQGDSTVRQSTDMRYSHRIFGYAKADTASERLLLLSFFTNDVDGNPFNCKLGAYYGTFQLQDFTLKYYAKEGAFVKLKVVGNTGKEMFIYIKRKWMEFQ